MLSLGMSSGVTCKAFIFAQHEQSYALHRTHCQGAAGACDRTGEGEPSWQGTSLSSTGQDSGKWEQSRDSDSDQMNTGKSYSDEAGQGRKSVCGLGPGSPSSQK